MVPKTLNSSLGFRVRDLVSRVQGVEGIYGPPTPHGFQKRILITRGSLPGILQEALCRARKSVNVEGLGLRAAGLRLGISSMAML